jgi:tryptophan synthase alpha subunit
MHFLHRQGVRLALATYGNGSLTRPSTSPMSSRGFGISTPAQAAAVAAVANGVVVGSALTQKVNEAADEYLRCRRLRTNRILEERYS